MLTKNLTKGQYYRTRHISAQNPLPKLIQQLPVRQHLIEPIPTLALQIKKHIQKKIIQQSWETQYIGFDASFHGLQVRMQDLSKIVANRQDEITALRNQKEKDQRRIALLDKEIFNLKTQIQQKQYEYKTMIDFLKSLNAAQRAQSFEKIQFLQDEGKRAKENYQNILKTTKEAYDSRISSFSGAKDVIKLASEEAIDSLKKDLEFNRNEIKRLRNELILSEKQAFEKVRYYEDQNYVLQEKLQTQEAEFSLAVLKNNTELSLNNTKMKQLNDQIEEMIRTFETEKSRIQHDQEHSQKFRTQREKKINQRNHNLLAEKQRLQIQLLATINELKQAKEANFHLRKDLNEMVPKISLLQLEKQQSEKRLESILHDLKLQQKKNLEIQTQSLKNTYQHKIVLVQNDLQNKQNQLQLYKDKIANLSQQIQTKLLAITSFEQKQINSQRQINDLLDQNQRLNKEIETLKQELQYSKTEFSNQKKKLIHKIAEEKSTELKQTVKQSNLIISNLRKQILQIKNQKDNDFKHHTEKLKMLQADFSIKLEQNKSLTLEKEHLQEKCYSLTSYCEEQKVYHKKYILGLQQVISEVQEALKRKNQDLQQIKFEYFKLQQETANNQTIIEQLQKQLKQSQISYDQFKLQSIKKNSEFEEKLQQHLNKVELQKFELITSLKKKQNQILQLSAKLEHAEQTFSTLRNQKQVFSAENKRLKEAYDKKEEKSKNLINQLNEERNKIAEKASQEYKQKMRQIHQKNQSFLAEIASLKEKNTQLDEFVQQGQSLSRQLRKKIDQKDYEIFLLSQKVQSAKKQIEKLEQRIADFKRTEFEFQNQTKNLQMQNDTLNNKIYQYHTKFEELRKATMLDSTLFQELKTKIARLELTIQEKQQQICNQKRQKQALQNALMQYKRQNMEKYSQIDSLEKQMSNYKIKVYEQATVTITNQIKKVGEEFKSKQNQWIEKINHLEDTLSANQDNLQKKESQILQRDKIIRNLQERLSNSKQKEKELNNCNEIIQDLNAKFKCNLEFVAKIQRQILTVNTELKNLEAEKNAEIAQLKLQIDDLSMNLNIANSKYNTELEKTQQLQKSSLKKMKTLQEDILAKEKIINSMRNEIKQLQYNKELLRSEIFKQYEEAISNLNLELEQKIQQCKLDHEKSKQNYKAQLFELHEKLQKSKSQNTILKVSFEEENHKKQQKILLLEQEIIGFSRINNYLYQYKRKWNRICGQVKECQSMDLADDDEIRNSLSKISMKSSVLIDQAFITKEQMEKYLPDNKFYFGSPEGKLREDVETQKKANIYRHMNIQNTEKIGKSKVLEYEQTAKPKQFIMNEQFEQKNELKQIHSSETVIKIEQTKLFQQTEKIETSKEFQTKISMFKTSS